MCQRSEAQGLIGTGPAGASMSRSGTTTPTDPFFCISRGNFTSSAGHHHRHPGCRRCPHECSRRRKRSSQCQHSPAAAPAADLDPRQAMHPSPDRAGRDAIPSPAAAAPSPSRAPPSLPDRHVTADSIEDAYVRFILYCNPALPPDADTASLRDAFRSPPRSGGKVFHPFTIFGLVSRFYAREIRTWTELATLLGVEPPDLSKDESAQKVAQYGVRLKKWMNSMHVRAFFEYLLSMPNDYWTSIPSDPNPVACPVRDGVAVEDDVALRALIPHMRPKRGRKRPDADEPAAQRLRLSDPSTVVDPLSAHSSGDAPMRTADGDPNRVASGYNDALQTPLGRWPQSAVTPSSRGTFWDESLEPRSAVTPSRRRPPRHRTGAKNVSSAWKPAGIHAGAKQRGRPPVGRTSTNGPALVMPTSKPPLNPSPVGPPLAPKQGQDHCQHRPRVSDQITPTPSAPPAPEQPTGRPSRPSISLMVPERQGGAVRLATPPPPQPEAVEHMQECNDTVAAQRGPQQDAPHTRQTPDNGWQRFAKEATDAYEQASKVPSSGCRDPETMPEYYFEKMEDRTNVDALMSYFVRSMSDSEWVDVEGNPAEPASVEESTALVNAMLQNMYKTSTSPQAFLISLAALAGSMTLVTSRPRCVRLGESNGSYVYRCDWEYRFGHVKCGFTMPQCVPRTMWKKAEAGTADAQQQQQQTPLTAEDWKRKYQALAEEVHKRNTELADLRAKVMTSLGREWTEP